MNKLAAGTTNATTPCLPTKTGPIPRGGASAIDEGDHLKKKKKKKKKKTNCNLQSSRDETLHTVLEYLAARLIN
jgi:hypothetical protein